jgi:hypothetical protein
VQPHKLNSPFAFESFSKKSESFGSEPSSGWDPAPKRGENGFEFGSRVDDQMDPNIP